MFTKLIIFQFNPIKLLTINFNFLNAQIYFTFKKYFQNSSLMIGKDFQFTDNNFTLAVHNTYHVYRQNLITLENIFQTNQRVNVKSRFNAARVQATINCPLKSNNTIHATAMRTHYTSPVSINHGNHCRLITANQHKGIST